MENVAFYVNIFNTPVKNNKKRNLHIYEDVVKHINTSMVILFHNTTSVIIQLTQRLMLLPREYLYGLITW